MKVISSVLMSLVLSFAVSASAQKKTGPVKPKPGAPSKETSAPETPPAQSPTAEPEQTAPTPAPESVPLAPAEPVVEKPVPTPATDETQGGSSHLFGLHAAVGLPHPVTVGLNYVHPSRLFSGELNFGSYAMTASDVDVKMTNAEVGLRWHPFAGSFYLGALIGSRSLTAEKTETIQGIPVSAKAEVKSNYVAPHIGWMWGLDGGGFFVSMDVGALSPNGATTTFTSDAPGAVQGTQEYIDLDKEVRDQGDKLGTMTLPLWTLLKLGWMF